MHPPSTSAHTKKRKRTDGSESTTPDPPTTSAPGPRPRGQAPGGSFNPPVAWLSFISDVPAAKVPPRNVLVKFGKIYNAALNSYRSIVKHHFKVIAARDHFAAESEGGNIPLMIANSFKGPLPFPFAKDYSAQAREDNAEAQEVYDRALVEMKQAAVTYIKSCHKINVDRSAAQINDDTRKIALSVELQSYASTILRVAECADNNLWSVYIAAVVSALGSELSDIRCDVAASVSAEKDQKAAKHASLTTAAIDVEMEDGTKPIQELINERVSMEVSKLSKTLTKDAEDTDTEPREKKVKPSPTAPNAEASSSNPKPVQQGNEKNKATGGNRKWKGKRKGKKEGRVGQV